MGMQHLIKAATAAGYSAVSHDLTPWDDVDDASNPRKALPAPTTPDDPLPRGLSTALVVTKPVWAAPAPKPGIAASIAAATQALGRSISGYVGRAPAGA